MPPKQVHSPAEETLFPRATPSIPSMPENMPTTPPELESESTDRLHRKLSWQIAANLFVSFKYAWAGISYAFATQRNFRLHVLIGSLAIALAIFLNLSLVEVTIIGLTIAAVMATELLNTAIESLVDLSLPNQYHELAKIAKDCAAGAVLVSSLAAILVAGCLLLPPLYELLR